VKSFKYGSSSSTVVRKSWVMASSGIMVVTVSTLGVVESS
jgi:hypothetical protein